MGILLKSQYNIKYAANEDSLAKISDPSVPYIGPYINTIFGKKYVGDSLLNKGEHLVNLVYPEAQKAGEDFFPYDRLKSDIANEANKREPIIGKNLPQTKDYKRGFFFRYFSRDLRTKLIIETTKEEYDSTQIDSNIFDKISVEWNLNPLSNLNKKTVNDLQKRGRVNISPYDYVTKRNEETPYTQ
jgi:hypothetical protein